MPIKELLIDLYAHCNVCMKQKPDDIAPFEYVDLSIGLTKTKDYVQIWCNRHNIEVALLQLAAPLDSKCTCEDC